MQAMQDATYSPLNMQSEGGYSSLTPQQAGLGALQAAMGMGGGRFPVHGGSGGSFPPAFPGGQGGRGSEFPTAFSGGQGAFGMAQPGFSGLDPATATLMQMQGMALGQPMMPSGMSPYAPAPQGGMSFPPVSPAEYASYYNRFMEAQAVGMNMAAMGMNMGPGMGGLGPQGGMGGVDVFAPGHGQGGKIKERDGRSQSYSAGHPGPMDPRIGQRMRSGDRSLSMIEPVHLQQQQQGGMRMGPNSDSHMHGSGQLMSHHSQEGYGPGGGYPQHQQHGNNNPNFGCGPVAHIFMLIAPAHMLLHACSSCCTIFMLTLYAQPAHHTRCPSRFSPIITHFLPSCHSHRKHLCSCHSLTARRAQQCPFPCNRPYNRHPLSKLLRHLGLEERSGSSQLMGPRCMGGVGTLSGGGRRGSRREGDPRGQAMLDDLKTGKGRRCVPSDPLKISISVSVSDYWNLNFCAAYLRQLRCQIPASITSHAQSRRQAQPSGAPCLELQQTLLMQWFVDGSHLHTFGWSCGMSA